MKKIFLLTFIVHCCCLLSQEIKIVDAATGQPVPYASVYLFNGTDKAGGLVCDENGTAELGTVLCTNFTISCIGYEDLKVSKNDSTSYTFHLSPKTTALKEVVVARKNKAVTLQYKGKGKNSRYGLAMGSEFTIYFKNKYKKPVPIKSLFFNIRESSPGTTILRVVMYAVTDSVKHNTLGPTLLDRDIIYTIHPNTKGLVEIDLSEYNLVLPENGAYLGTDTLNNLDTNGNSHRDSKYIPRVECLSADLNYFLFFDKYKNERYNNYNMHVEHLMSYKKNWRDFCFPNYGIKVFAD